MSDFTAMGRLADAMSAGLPPLKSRALITQVVGILGQAAQEEAPERDGTLKHSMHERVDSPYAGVVEFQAPHALFVVNGTPPHTIEARPGHTLRFVINGVTLFRKKVRHPGTKPNRFPDRAVRRAQPAIEQAGAGWLVDVAVAVTR
jgi:hypothetical protein